MDGYATGLAVPRAIAATLRLNGTMRKLGRAGQGLRAEGLAWFRV